MLGCIVTPGLLEFLVPPLVLCLVALWSSRAGSSMLLPIGVSALAGAALVAPNLFDGVPMGASDVLWWILIPAAGMTVSTFAGWFVGRRAMAHQVAPGRAWTLGFVAGSAIALLVGVYMYSVACMVETGGLAI